MFAEVDAAGAQLGGVDRSGTSSKEPSRVRVEFPETWLWSESVAGYLLTPRYLCLKIHSFSWYIGHRNYSPIICNCLMAILVPKCEDILDSVNCIRCNSALVQFLLKSAGIIRGRRLCLGLTWLLLNLPVLTGCR